MPKNAKLEIKNGKMVETINDFLRSLLEKKLLDALLAPMELPSKNMVTLSLVSDPGKLKDTNILAPVMPVSAARVVSSLTRISSSQRKVGVVLRACELRALIELAKLKQASLENLILIGVDCFGTYSPTSYAELCQEVNAPTDEFLSRVKDGTDLHLREACQVCEHPVPLGTDLLIKLIGMDLEKSIIIQATGSEGEHILEVMAFEESTDNANRENATSKLIASRTENRDKLLSQFQGNTTGLDNLLPIFDSCTGCHNCRVACPICYCKECLFDSSTFEWDAESYLGQADRKGALRMPADNLLYHLTRLYHVGASCVGCGLCQDACPNNISIFQIFHLVGSQVQKTFDYVPGRSLEEELPLVVFSEDELSEVGM